MRGTNYIELNNIPTIKIKWFAPLLRTADEKKMYCYYNKIISGGSLYPMSIQVAADYGEDNTLTLLLKWEGMRQDIRIVREESRLVRGTYVYYFLCPYGYKSFKLFYINGEWRSRRSFKAYYAQQMKSKKWRELDYLSVPPPFDNGKRKEYYRGELTPYGKRLRRYRQQQDRGEEALAKYIFKVNKSVTKL